MRKSLPKNHFSGSLFLRNDTSEFHRIDIGAHKKKKQLNNKTSNVSICISMVF